MYIKQNAIKRTLKINYFCLWLRSSRCLRTLEAFFEGEPTVAVFSGHVSWLMGPYYCYIHCSRLAKFTQNLRQCELHLDF